MKVWNKEGAHVLQKARGTYAPYRIRNCTGYEVYIWSDVSGSSEVDETSVAKLSVGETTEWRFDDWRTAREVSAATSRCGLFIISTARVIPGPTSHWFTIRCEALGATA
jgi:hypothetical protein